MKAHGVCSISFPNDEFAKGLGLSRDRDASCDAEWLQSTTDFLQIHPRHTEGVAPLGMRLIKQGQPGTGSGQQVGHRLLVTRFDPGQRNRALGWCGAPLRAARAVQPLAMGHHLPASDGDTKTQHRSGTRSCQLRYGNAKREAGPGKELPDMSEAGADSRRKKR